MAKEKNNSKTKDQKIYNLVIYDEKTLDQKFSLRLTSLNLYTLFGSIFLVVAIIVVLLLIFTPLNRILPKYEDIKLRAQATQNRILIDSLKHEIDIRDNYFKKIRTIIYGSDLSELGSSDSAAEKFYLTPSAHDSLLKQLTSDMETTFELPTIQGEENTLTGLRFYKPVGGIIINKFNPAEGHYGVDLTAQKDEPVLSVLSGTVIMAGWNPQNGYVIMVQHPHNLISVYKHNSELLKHQGDHVEAGEPIAIVGNTGENTTGPHLHFELWFNGVPVNPADYIMF